MDNKDLDFILQELIEFYKKKEKGICPWCDREVNLLELKDERSVKEFELSGFCQECQDNYFK